MEDREAQRGVLLARLSDPHLEPLDVISLASRNVRLLDDPVVQDLLYHHPATDLFVALEVTLQLTVRYYHDNSGPGDLARMRAGAPAHLRPAIDLAWGYHWVDRWELRCLRVLHETLPPRAAEVFRTLLLDAAAAGTVPTRAAPLREWAGRLADASTVLAT